MSPPPLQAPRSLLTRLEGLRSGCEEKLRFANEMEGVIDEPAPQLVESRPEPVIDEDGFELVQPKKFQSLSFRLCSRRGSSVVMSPPPLQAPRSLLTRLEKGGQDILE
jgi:hypothetical protein